MVVKQEMEAAGVVEDDDKERNVPYEMNMY